MEHSGRDELWPEGTPVRVRTRFEQSWAGGFEVAEGRRPAEAEPPRYRVRRTSDGFVVPADFSVDEVRVDPEGG